MNKARKKQPKKPNIAGRNHQRDTNGGFILHPCVVELVIDLTDRLSHNAAGVAIH
jgi:hypothetical protein